MDLFDNLIPFVAIAEAGSFREAARGLGVTASAVSKAIAKLENDVGVRLLHRTARRVQPTTEGEDFLHACRDAVTKIRSARERLQDSQRAPRGRLRVSLPPVFSARVVAALPRLLAMYPELAVEVTATDRFVQLTDENVDVAIRIGTSDDSTNVARKLRTLALATVASPSYLARCGTPRTPAELEHHACLRFVLPTGVPQPWLFRTRRATTTTRVSGVLTADHGEALLAAAIAGIGIIQAPDVMISDAIERGDLVQILTPFAAAGPPLVALCAPGRNRSPKVRAFVDFVHHLVCSQSATGEQRSRKASEPR